MENTLMPERLNRKEAFRYMGYRKGDEDDIPDSIISLTDECENALLEVITPRMVYRVFETENTPSGVLLKNTSLTLTGKDIAVHLAGCDRAVLFCVTLSVGVDRLISSYEHSCMEKAVICDALASAAVEQVCDAAEKAIRDEIGGYFTWRFSPGYGDLPLTLQDSFIKVTDAARRTGLSVNSSHILIPRKSVTAILGISQNALPQKRRGCTSCNMKDNCRYRKEGITCQTSTNC